MTVEIYREFDADTTPTRFANFVPTTSGGGVNDMVLVGSSVSGMYSLEVTAAQLNFTGPMILTIVDTDSAGIVGLPYWRPFILTSANVVDAEYGTDKLQVDQVELGSSTQSTTDLKDFADAGYNPATDKVTGVLLTDTTTASTNAETAIGNLKDFDPANDDVAKVTLVVTTTTNSDMVSAPLTAQETEDEAVDALESFNLDHLVKWAVDTNYQTTVHNDSVIGYMTTSSATADYVRTEDSLEDLRDRGDTAWITATGFSTHDAAAVWAVTMENAKSYAQVMRVFAAVLSGKSSAAAGQISFVGIDGTTTRLTVTVSSGARTSVDVWDGD